MKRSILSVAVIVMLAIGSAFTSKSYLSKFSNVREAPTGSSSPCNLATHTCGGSTRNCIDGGNTVYNQTDASCVTPLQQDN